MKTAELSHDILAMLLHRTIPAWQTAREFWLSLHDGPPVDQKNREVTYPGYTRLKTVRNKTDWNHNGETFSNRRDMDFALCTGDQQFTITHIGLGTAQSGSGSLLRIIQLDTPLIIGRNTIPRLAAGQIVLAEE